jgi:hypothetical protein
MKKPRPRTVVAKLRDGLGGQISIRGGARLRQCGAVEMRTARAMVLQWRVWQRSSGCGGTWVSERGSATRVEERRRIEEEDEKLDLNVRLKKD